MELKGQWAASLKYHSPETDPHATAGIPTSFDVAKIRIPPSKLATLRVVGKTLQRQPNGRLCVLELFLIISTPPSASVGRSIVIIVYKQRNAGFVYHGGYI
jgi:hypothetical protein